jgi:hypothetical protein
MSVNALKGLKPSDFYARMASYIQAFREGNALRLWVLNLPAGQLNIGSLITSDKVFGPYGVLEWVGKISRGTPSTTLWAGLERTHGSALNGAIWFIIVSQQPRVQTYDDNGNLEQTVLAAEDWWTNSHRFKIDWAAPSPAYPNGYVAFYRDDVLLARHVTRVPKRSAPFFLEVYADASAGAIPGPVQVELDLSSVGSPAALPG